MIEIIIAGIIIFFVALSFLILVKGKRKEIIIGMFLLLMAALIVAACCKYILMDKVSNITAKDLTEKNTRIYFLASRALKQFDIGGVSKQVISEKDLFEKALIAMLGDLTALRNSEEIAFVVYTIEEYPTSQIWIIKGESKKLLTYLPHEVLGLSWSPDGRFMAYWSAKENQFKQIDLYLMEVESKKTRMLKENCGYDYYNAGRISPSWSPDSKYLVYANKDRQVEIMDITTGETRTLVSGVMPSWSPDGKLIAYRESQDRPWSDRISNYFSICPDGTHQEFIFDANSHTDSLFPGLSDRKKLIWSPDGRSLFFIKYYESPWTGDTISKFFAFNRASKKISPISGELKGYIDSFFVNSGDTIPNYKK